MVSIRIATFLSLALNLFAQPTPPLTAEQRADILMARKMYREAAEVYRAAPLDSAITWNKIGIAYQQMLQIKEAQKNYEKAIKINPKYSEAINNLSTHSYTQYSFRPSILH